MQFGSEASPLAEPEQSPMGVPKSANETEAMVEPAGAPEVGAARVAEDARTQRVNAAKSARKAQAEERARLQQA